MIIARLVNEFGPRENWPTRQFGLGDLPEVDEIFINTRLLQRMQGDGEPYSEDEELEYWTEGTSDPFEDLPKGEVTKRVEARRAERRARRNRQMKTSGY